MRSERGLKRADQVSKCLHLKQDFEKPVEILLSDIDSGEFRFDFFQHKEFEAAFFTFHSLNLSEVRRIFLIFVFENNWYGVLLFF